jgi:hypothetical protein
VLSNIKYRPSFDFLFRLVQAEIKWSKDCWGKINDLLYAASFNQKKIDIVSAHGFICHYPAIFNPHEGHEERIKVQDVER